MSSLENLLRYIVEDDGINAAASIGKEPHLGTAPVKTARLYESKIVHWLYAGDTPMHLAAAGHRVEILEILLAAGADCNVVGTYRKTRPLHYAADGYLRNPSYDATKQAHSLKRLIKAGADIEAKDKNGATALHRATRTRCAAAVKTLLEAGADPMAKNHSGATPLHLAAANTGHGGSGEEAARTGQRLIIQLLMAHGATPRTKDSRGKSVLEWATVKWVQQLFADLGAAGV